MVASQTLAPELPRKPTRRLRPRSRSWASRPTAGPTPPNPWRRSVSTDRFPPCAPAEDS